MKKTLIALLILTGLSLNPLITKSKNDGEKKDENANGRTIVSSKEKGILSYALVKVYKENSKDTLTYQTDFMGSFYYTIPTNSLTKYKMKVSPGKNSLDSEGDIFEPYETEFTVNQGNNDLIFLED